MNQDQGLHRKLILIRVLVWGQVAGVLWQALSLAIDDVPEIFLRVSPFSFLWPILIIAGMHLFHLDSILAGLLPKGMLALFTAIACLGTTAAAVGVLFYYQIPPDLRLPEWNFPFLAAWLALAIFLMAFLAAAYAAFRMFTQNAAPEA